MLRRETKDTYVNQNEDKDKVLDWALDKLNFPNPGSMIHSLFTEDDISYLDSLYGYHAELKELEDYLARKKTKD